MIIFSQKLDTMLYTVLLVLQMSPLLLILISFDYHIHLRILIS
jgi:hypothetical protein